MKKGVENILNIDILFLIINVKIYLGFDNMLSSKLETKRLILRRYEENILEKIKLFIEKRKSEFK